MYQLVAAVLTTAMAFKIDDAQLNLDFLETRSLLGKPPRGHSIFRL